MGREIDRLTALLEQIRSLDRPLTVDLQRIDLLKLLEEIWVFEEPACRAAGIKVIHSYSPIPPVKADRNRMKQAILNLIKNAVEAMPDGGQLEIKTYALGDRVHVEVKDSGAGIPPDVDIFAVFKTTKANGTGLGLPFVKQIVDARTMEASIMDLPRKQVRRSRFRCRFTGKSVPRRAGKAARSSAARAFMKVTRDGDYRIYRISSGG